MRGGKPESNVRADLEALTGQALPDDWVDPTEDDEPGVMEVWPENWPAVLCFNALATQWRRKGDRVVGLIYASIGVVAEGLGSSLSAVFAGVQDMEAAALAAYRRKGL